MLGQTGWRRRGQQGVVGINLVVVLAFALYAVIQLSRVTLAAKQIDDRVEVITAEVGPGSNVSRLDETAILDTVGDRAEQIRAAAEPLTGQAGAILTAAQSIDRTASNIFTAAGEINGVVRSINGTIGQLPPVVRSINDGVAATNGRVERARGPVAGIRDDLNNVLREVVVIDAHATALCSVGLIPTVGGGPCPP